MSDQPETPLGRLLYGLVTPFIMASCLGQYAIHGNRSFLATAIVCAYVSLSWQIDRARHR